MRRIVRIAAAMALMASAGCQSLGLPFTWRSIGHLPGIDPTFYAYYFWQGKAYQTFQYSVEQVRTSALQALADLGYGQIEQTREGACTVITATTPDGRAARVTVAPRNAMTEMTVRIGYFPCGDEPASKALIDRVAENFGTVERTVVPLEPTLQRRINPMPAVPQPPLAEIPPPLPVEMPAYLAAPGTGGGPAAPPMALPGGPGVAPNPILPPGPVPYGPFQNEPNTYIPPVAPSTTPLSPDF